MINVRRLNSEHTFALFILNIITFSNVLISHRSIAKKLMKDNLNRK